MSLFKKLQKKIDAYETKRYSKKAGKLEALRKKRIKLEGRVKIGQLEAKEKARIAKAKGKLRPKRDGLKKAFGSIEKSVKTAKKKMGGVRSEAFSLKAKDVYGFKKN